MSNKVDALFAPFKNKGLSLDNRVVMAPMTREFSPGGVPTSDVAEYQRSGSDNERSYSSVSW